MVNATTAELKIIRSLIPDTDEVFGDGENEYMFDDEELQNYFAVSSGSVLRAAAFACMAAASSEAIISKKIREQDLQTDGPAVSDALIKKANVLFAQADAQDAAAQVSEFNIYYFGGPGRPELTDYPVATYWGN